MIEITYNPNFLDRTERCVYPVQRFARLPHHAPSPSRPGAQLILKTRRGKLLNSSKGDWFIGGTAARHLNRRHHLCRRRPISVVAEAAISVAAVLTIPDGALVANPAATNLRRLCLPRRSHLRRRQLGRQLRRRGRRDLRRHRRHQLRHRQPRRRHFRRLQLRHLRHGFLIFNIIGDIGEIGAEKRWRRQSEP